MAIDRGGPIYLIEDKSSGTQLIQELIRHRMYGITRYEPTGEKIMRMFSVTNMIENGFVMLRQRPIGWAPTFMNPSVSRMANTTTKSTQLPRRSIGEDSVPSVARHRIPSPSGARFGSSTRSVDDQRLGRYLRLGGCPRAVRSVKTQVRPNIAATATATSADTIGIRLRSAGEKFQDVFSLMEISSNGTNDWNFGSAQRRASLIPPEKTRDFN
jgi:hypothetical protein